MQIVINISKEEYNRIQRLDWKNGDRIYGEVTRAIHYGTPLPKGHGRLVDVSDLLISIMKYMDGDKTLGQCIDDTPTVLEAEGEKCDE